MHYGAYLRAIRRATNLFFRHRARGKRPRRFRSTDDGVPLVRGARHEPVRSVRRQLLVLVLPPLLIGAVGVLSLFTSELRLDIEELWFLGAAAVFAVRSVTARARWRMRILALAASLAYPVLRLLHVLGAF